MNERDFTTAKHAHRPVVAPYVDPSEVARATVQLTPDHELRTATGIDAALERLRMPEAPSLDELLAATEQATRAASDLAARNVEATERLATAAERIATALEALATKEAGK